MQALPYYLDLLRTANLDKTKNLTLYEDEIIGFNHQQVGYCLAARYEFPWILAHAILTHEQIETPSIYQTKEQEEKSLIVSLVHLGEAISNRFRRQMHRRESSEHWPNEWPKFPEGIYSYLGVNVDELGNIMLDILDSCEEILYANGA